LKKRYAAWLEWSGI